MVQCYNLLYYVVLLARLDRNWAIVDVAWLAFAMHAIYIIATTVACVIVGPIL